MSNPQTEACDNVGKTILFDGITDTLTISQLVAHAQRAKTLGFDTYAPRRAQGTIKYYHTPAQLSAEYQAVTKQGIGYLPFHYGYGPAFGISFVDEECAVLLEMTEAIKAGGGGYDGFVMEDLEVEYDNRPDAAARFTHNMLGKPGLLYMTTWADPRLQGWEQNIQALKPCVNMWIPQEYDNFLASQPHDMPFVAPGIDLSQEFGPNNQAAIIKAAASQGACSVFMWDYSLTQNQPFVHSLTSLAKQVLK